jgi:hypothetical protein
MCDGSIRFAFSCLFAVCFSFNVLPFFFALDFRGDLPAMATPSLTIRRARVVIRLSGSRIQWQVIFMVQWAIHRPAVVGPIEGRPRAWPIAVTSSSKDRWSQEVSSNAGAASRGIDPTVLPDRTAWTVAPTPVPETFANATAPGGRQGDVRFAAADRRTMKVSLKTPVA